MASLEQHRIKARFMYSVMKLLLQGLLDRRTRTVQVRVVPFFWKKRAEMSASCSLTTAPIEHPLPRSACALPLYTYHPGERESVSIKACTHSLFARATLRL